MIIKNRWTITTAVTLALPLWALGTSAALAGPPRSGGTTVTGTGPNGDQDQHRHHHASVQLKPRSSGVESSRFGA